MNEGPNSHKLDLIDEVSNYYNDPLGFVMFAFPWGEKGTILEHQTGPDDWQILEFQRMAAHMRKEPFTGANQVMPYKSAISSGHGSGKGQTLTSKMLTLNMNQDNIPTSISEVKVGTVKIGDYVFGSNGEPTKIVATNHYRREHFRVTFDDGSFLDVSGEHEWAVRGRNERRTKSEGWRILETQEILEMGVLRANGKSQAKQWEIPIQGAAQFAYQPVYDPYTVGMWLGDGCSTTGSITSTRDELWVRMGLSPKKDTNRYKLDRSMSMSPPDLKSSLVKYGMVPATSDIKFVPDLFKYNSERVRTELIKGMMDSDGEVTSSGTISYSSTSKRLCEDLMWLIRSIGGKAMLQPTPKQTFYVKDGVRSEPCKPCYRVSITLSFNPFTHKLKKAKWKTDIQHRYLCRWISSIESIGMQDGMCITVEAEDHLYLATDFIVTHNSCYTAFLILWIMSTRPMARGVVTANTFGQLKTKTWVELAKWHSLLINKHWFKLNSMSIQHVSYSDWRIDACANDEGNPAAFQGMHNAASSVLMIVDEASGLSKVIHEAILGSLSDGEGWYFKFGNPNNNSGPFYDAFHGSKHQYNTQQIDCTKAKMTNKVLLQSWIDEYGYDSDFCRVRVFGKFPKQADGQFISAADVMDAYARGREGSGMFMPDQPLILGIDVSRGGEDSTVYFFRRGDDCVSLPIYKLSGEKSRNSMLVVSNAAMLIKRHEPDAIFVDGTGIGGPICDRINQLGHRATEIHFGSTANDIKKYQSKASEMWWRMRQWIMNHRSRLPDDHDLEQELTNRLYEHNQKDQLVVEPKKMMKLRGVGSPDIADALALTFAVDVAALDITPEQRTGRTPSESERSYDPMDRMGSGMDY